MLLYHIFIILLNINASGLSFVINFQCILFNVLVLSLTFVHVTHLFLFKPPPAPYFFHLDYCCKTNILDFGGPTPFFDNTLLPVCRSQSLPLSKSWYNSNCLNFFCCCGLTDFVIQITVSAWHQSGVRLLQH